MIPADRRAAIGLSAPALPGGDLSVRFSGVPGFKLDWVGIYLAGAVSVYDYIGLAYTGARHEGDLRFPGEELNLPREPDDYEVRLMLDDAYQIQAIGTFIVAAR